MSDNNNSGEEFIQQRRSKKRKFEEISNEDSSEIASAIPSNMSVNFSYLKIDAEQKNVDYLCEKCTWKVVA